MDRDHLSRDPISVYFGRDPDGKGHAADGLSADFMPGAAAVEGAAAGAEAAAGADAAGAGDTHNLASQPENLRPCRKNCPRHPLR